jgi:hypothetical protein
MPECFEEPVVTYYTGSGCDEDLVPIKIVTMPDDGVVTFQGIGAQTVTFRHSSNTVQTVELTAESYSNVVLEGSCSGDPSVSVVQTTTAAGCTYDVAVPCSVDDMCNSPTSDGRRMHEESFKHDSVHESEEDLEDAPYCLSEDFPCEGEEDNMVYVCHYIPRQGYQTFCVPEADSVILGFYLNDYCGPCEGGYGSVGK